ncbi:hypothetical protein GCM10010399_75660 [Dactylosporangium fulvum]|uniref:LLM class flavin-dependent oxidoreductase n=1 Tax=Dactylosporangium fulvum TaxID=53359 RepID=A0ABY5VQV2_9ACTN|nr:LLM class flavin-dependent oxidoreductase [Dactylosporangium fulvum]UWP79186.1 LLM class flavin-dependent oxidoreductase [Dactylosporangium fulvum]
MIAGVDVYSTFPRDDGSSPDFLRHAADALRWTEAAGIIGTLIAGDHECVDPWVGAQLVLEQSSTLVPVVATDPADLHPFGAARKVTTLSTLFGRRVDLDLVAGGNQAELRALGIFLDHHERYDRLTEYGQIIIALLAPGGPTTYRGNFYEMSDAAVRPPLPPGLAPHFFVTGSSPAAAAASRALGATRLTTARALEEYGADSQRRHSGGLRLGLIARETSAQAWQEARRRYPGDNGRYDGAFWSHPLDAPSARCPYLVGSESEVAQTLAQYFDLGLEVLVLGPPHDEDDQHQAMSAVRLARRLRTKASGAPMRGWPVQSMTPMTADGGAPLTADSLQATPADM